MCFLTKPFPDGLYKCFIKHVALIDGFFIIQYDIAEGPHVGWASKLFNESGKWPLIWRIKDGKGKYVIKKALEAINAGRAVPINLLLDAAGSNIILQLEHNGQYINVLRSFPVSTQPTIPNDILIDKASWSKGSDACTDAVYLAAYSGHPVIYADRNESKSPMIEWAANHNHILLQRSLEYGDYALKDSCVAVDRKKNILELYNDFIGSASRKPREIAALNAQIDGNRLVYVIGTTAADNVSCIGDIVGWRTTQNGHSFKGTDLAQQLYRHMEFFPNVDFIFVLEDQLEGKIFEVLQSGLPKSNPGAGVQGP